MPWVEMFKVSLTYLRTRESALDVPDDGKQNPFRRMTSEFNMVR